MMTRRFTTGPRIHRFGPVALAAGAALLTAGCQSDLYYPTMGDVKEVARLGREQLDAHDHNMTEQHKAIAPQAAAPIDAQRDLFAARLDQLAHQTEALESKHAALAREALTLAAQVSGLPAALSGSIRESIDPDIEAARDEARGAASDAALVQAGLDELSRGAQQARDDLVQVREAFDDLSDDVAARLGQVTQDTLSRLEKLRDQDEEFRRLLREELKLTPADLEALKGMSTEQILALIASAIGAAGIGMFGGRSGKSRAEPRVEKLETKVSDLAEELKLRTPPP